MKALRNNLETDFKQNESNTYSQWRGLSGIMDFSE